MVDIKITPEGGVRIKTTEPRYQKTPREIPAGYALVGRDLVPLDNQDKDVKSNETEKPETVAYRMGFAAAIALADIAQQAGELSQFFSANIDGWEDPNEPFVPANEREAELHERAKQINELKRPWHANYGVPEDAVHVGFSPSGDPIFEQGIKTLPPEIQPASTFAEQAAMKARWDAAKNPDGILHPGSESHDIKGPAIDVDCPEDHGVPLTSSETPAAAIHLAGAGLALKADGPGEPVPDEPVPNAGTWTISDDELQSRLESEYRRGRQEGTFEGANAIRQINGTKLQALFKDVVDEIGLQPWETIDPSFQLTIYRQLVRRLGYNVIDD